MDARPLKFIAAACAGELLQGAPDTLATRVCTDSRQARAGDVFIALRGERFDGHDFVDDVAAKGVVAVVVERGKIPSPQLPAAVIVVNDTRRALLDLAAAYRADFNLPVVAVGGSNGKTTTKDLIASVLGMGFSTLASEASFNNDIGVPLTLLRLESSHQLAVLELGTNHPGELAPLLRLAQPRLGVITNIGREHLEFFGDLEGVAQEEGVLAEHLPADGTLFLNGDDAWSEAIARRTAARVVRVGWGEGNDWRAREARLTGDGVAFHVEVPRPELSGEYQLQLLGRHQITNALFALGVGEELGLGRDALRRGLAECPPPPGRMRRWEHKGVQILDDTYNANADSMVAALQALVELPCKGRRLAVLGDMAELGTHSDAAHAEVGRRAAELGVGQLFAIGRMAPIMAQGARAAGLTRVIEFLDVEPAAAALKHFVKPGDLVLLKASRLTRLERVAEALRTNGQKYG
ncbi:MAG TPA: UDP-N-acetylmuramoyl-tripeptide--D-alanyl-D-alanine ligase [Verrucomicrobiota bacterium]|nr:MAG: UDP-N-acetylmuramoyl-tripeptide--D-alanyl-D-alanine ligase [Verrucomicrobia bacterium ADurb.Bin118]HPY30451.1 UDP-N-acetylmuramoyl-tripeptide--D-alanyl-D-alanine ligase [Verrucomicrobiota bacterium]HQB15352.1 UDP-N-acetylmuramoyl-tripeptide--D-alanyl-D-alanine ligase [Verrucomicrobiota bacterium]